jgi:hypothetical protein
MGIKTFSHSLKLLVSAALAIPVAMPTQAFAVEPAGHKFCENGVGNPEQLAHKIDVSLTADPTGHRALEGCRANPLHFLYAFQQTKSGKSLTSVKDLPAFVRRLVPIKVNEASTWVVSCLWDTTRGFGVKTDCEERGLAPGEIVYGDPVTKELLILGSCANPGLKEPPPIVVAAACREVDFPPMAKGVAIRFAYIGSRPLSGRCHKYLLAGESQPRTSTPEECPDTYETIRNGRKIKVVCSWADDEVAVSQKLGTSAKVQNVSGSFYARVPEGVNKWYLPPDADDGYAVICWELPNGEVVTLGVTKRDYVNNVATITTQQVRTLRYAGN